MTIDECMQQLEEARARFGGNAPVVLETKDGLFLVRTVEAEELAQIGPRRWARTESYRHVQRAAVIKASTNQTTLAAIGAAEDGKVSDVNLDDL